MKLQQNWTRHLCVQQRRLAGRTEWKTLLAINRIRVDTLNITSRKDILSRRCYNITWYNYKHMICRYTQIWQNILVCCLDNAPRKVSFFSAITWQMIQAGHLLNCKNWKLPVCTSVYIFRKNAGKKCQSSKISHILPYFNFLLYIRKRFLSLKFYQ